MDHTSSVPGVSSGAASGAAAAAAPTRGSGAVLTIDLGALVANWRLIRDRVGAGHTGAVVKADAYGLGARQAVLALAAAGCRHFFVAHLCEAEAIADLMPQDALLFILNGLLPGAEEACAAGGFVPVLNSLGQARRWQAQAARAGRALPAVLQFDSGMSRLGVAPDEAAELAGDAQFLKAVPLLAVMSHLACADEPSAPSNRAQLAAFEALAARFPGAARSLANSGGCLLSAPFHGDIARPGLALYGAEPVIGGEAPLRPVVRLEAPVIMLRSIADGTGVGYGLTWHAQGPRRLATIGVGYADGWLRSLSSRGAVWFEGVRLPIAGRVSMDSIVVDITALPEGALGEGDLVELIGPSQTLEDVAREAGTISYEILTGLGHRYTRIYRPADAQAAPARPETKEALA